MKYKRWIVLKGKDLGFSEIGVYPANSGKTDYVSWINPYIETNRVDIYFLLPAKHLSNGRYSATYTQ